MNGTPELHLVKIVFFADGIGKTWENPNPPKPNTRHLIVAVDTSGSMQSHTNELRVALSLVSALAGKPEIPQVPEPNGRTDLLGALQALIPAPAEKIVVADDTRAQVLVFTDGLDNYQHLVSLATGWEADGKTPSMRAMQPEGMALTDKQYIERRQEMVLEHATEYLGAFVALIGVGTQVSELLKVARKLPITVGVLAPLAADADDADHAERTRDVCHVIKTVVTKPRASRPASGKQNEITRTQPRPAKREPKERKEVEASVPTEMVTAVKEGAAKVVISSAPEPMPVAEWKASLGVAESRLDLAPDYALPTDQRDAQWTDKEWVLKFTRAALLWLLAESQTRNGECLAGAVLGGGQTSIIKPEFKTKYPGWKSTMNKLLSALKGSNAGDARSKPLLKTETAKKDDEWSFEHPQLSKALKYKGVVRYAAAESTVETVKELCAEWVNGGNDWALARDEFLKHSILADESAEPPAKRAKTEA